MPVKAEFLRSILAPPSATAAAFHFLADPSLWKGRRVCGSFLPVGATAEVRRETLYITEPPGGRDCGRPGFCSWCGEEIVLVDPVKEYRRRSRTRHHGDEHEIGDRNCGREFARSYCWDARTALYIIAADAGRPIACVECGLVCEEKIDGEWEAYERWDADHRVPLVDGGRHDVDNLQALCVPCHRRKTAREARARKGTR